MEIILPEHSPERGWVVVTDADKTWRYADG